MRIFFGSPCVESINLGWILYPRKLLRSPILVGHHLSSGLCKMRASCVTKMKHSLTIWFCRDELSFAMLFWEDMITLISMVEVLLFLLSIWTFILNHLDLNIHATIKKITLRIMLGSIPHQKFLFYHLPTQGRAGIKIGDAWYVSNVSIIFDCSMLLYILFWTFNGLYYTLLYY